MADKKISALTASALPLAGTEVLPIVQSGSTVKVAVSDLTAGRAVSATQLTLSTGNLIIGTTAKGLTTGSSIPLGFGVNNTVTAMTISTTSKVGVGTTTPVDLLSVSDGSIGVSISGSGADIQMGRIAMYSTASSGSYTNYGGEIRSFCGAGIDVSDLRFYTANGAVSSERMRISPAGNITASVGNLVIGTTAKGLTTGSAIPLGFGTNNSVADMTLDTSGNLILGSTNLGGKLSVFTGSGVGQFIRVQQINATLMEFRNAQDVGGNITIVAGGATSYNTISDERLKHDIVDAPDAANLIDALQVRSFKWKVDDTAQRYGFIAQELLEVAPEAVNVPEDEDKMMGVDHSKLVPMLVKEVQSLRARVAQLEGK